MKDEIVRIAGLTGSLRKGSYNMAALKAAGELLPAGAELRILDPSPLPFLNEDVEAAGVPAVVLAFKEELAAADALLISTPEYNYSIPPVLKNALDWASRGELLPLEGKPLAIMSASPGMLGGVRAQFQLRQMCAALDLRPLNRPEVMIGGAHKKFDQEGRLVDELTAKFIGKLLAALVDTVRDCRR